MKTKQLLLGLIAINLVGISALLYNRREASPRVPSSPAQLAADPSALSESDFVLPPRPAREVPDSTAGGSTQIELLRTRAFDIAEATVKRLRGNPGALCLLGKLHMRAGDPAGARLLWDQAIELDRDFAEPYLDKGHLEEKLGNTAKAEQFFHAALEKDPELLDAYASLADALVNQSKFSEAANILERLLAKDPASVVGWCKLGGARQQLREYAGAVQSYSRALELDQNSSEAAVGLMAAYRGQGDTANVRKTAEQFEEIAKRVPRTTDNRDVVGRDREKMQDLLVYTAQTSAKLLARAGESTYAVDQLESTLNVVPEAFPLRSLLAEMYLRDGSIDQAIRQLRTQADLTPENPGAWMELALLCIKTRRLDAAETALERVIELVPDSDRGFSLLAQTQMPAGRDQQAAVQNARRAVELSPDAANHYILATAYYHVGDLTNTRDELAKAIALDPGNSEYRDALKRIE